MTPVVARHSEGYPAAVEEFIPDTHVDALVSDLSISVRTSLPQFGCGVAGDHQVACFVIYAHPLYALERELDDRRVRAGRDHEILFKIAAVVMEEQVDAVVTAGRS